MLTRIKGGFLRWWSKPVRPLLLLIPTIVAAMLMVAGSTLAWFITTDGVQNDFTAGKIKFSAEVVDDFPPNQPVVLKPGDGVLRKEVGAKNTGDVPGFVRILVQAVIFKKDEATPLPAEIGKEVLLNIDPTGSGDWVLGEDGYYYYTKLLLPGQSTPLLFSEVRLAPVLPDEYQEATMKIEVKMEGVDYFKPHYREAWWEVSPPVLPNLVAIDGILDGLAK